MEMPHSHMRTSLTKNSKKTLISIQELMISRQAKEATKVAIKIQLEMPGEIITITAIPMGLIALLIEVELHKQHGVEDKTNTKAIQAAKISGVATTIMALKAIAGVEITITISKTLMEVSTTLVTLIDQLRASIIVQVASIMEVLKPHNLEIQDLIDLLTHHGARLISSRILPGEAAILLTTGANLIV